jgi:hypothetical protein
MSGVDNTIHDLAILLLNFQQEGKHGRPELPSAVRGTFEKLNTHLSNRLGSAGYQALLSRALALAKADFPWLDLVRVGKDGTLEGLFEAAASQNTSIVVDGSVAIVSNFIRLLETFVGRDLSMRLLNGVWPNAIQIDDTGLKENSNG